MEALKAQAPPEEDENVPITVRKWGRFYYVDMTNLEILKQRLVLYRQAERDILSGQTVEIEGMRITRADLDTVRRMINNLMNQIAELTRTVRRPRIRIGVPV